MYHLFIYLFICWSNRMAALLLWYHSTALCTDISASAICYLWRFFLVPGRLSVLFIQLFVFICWSYRMVALMLCYHSIAPSTCKDDIRASAVCHLQRFSLVNWCVGGLHTFPLATLVVYSVILRSTLLHRGYSQRLGGS